MEEQKLTTKFKLSVEKEGSVTDPTYLPERFEAFTPKDFVNTKECEMCEKVFGFTTSKHHWYHHTVFMPPSRRCNKCVCEECSKNRRPLSKSDRNYYRVCDYCDKKMEYAKVD